MEHPKGNTKKLLELINEFVGHTINMQKSTVFLYNKNKLSQGKINKPTPPIIASKRKKIIPRNKTKEIKGLVHSFLIFLKV